MFLSKLNSKTNLFVALAGAVVLSVSGWAATGSVDTVVSQKGRKFDPLSVTVDKGGALVIVNDDGDLLHHAFIESESFNFDSGDQKPGSRTRIVFPVTGNFKLLCGIHPKMKLAVQVR